MVIEYRKLNNYDEKEKILTIYLKWVGDSVKPIINKVWGALE